MLLVYTPKITPRLKFAFKHVCVNILGISVDFTTTVENFVSHDSLKMSYAKKPLGKEVFISSAAILFEQGLSDYTISVADWEDTKCFFAANPDSHLPFDIFAATFYLLSRYEEYLPHVKNNYGGYKMENSLAFREGFLKQPVIDIWALKFKKCLLNSYPEFEFPEKTYTIQPIIDVGTAYYYKHKGTVRIIGSLFKDVIGLRFTNIYTCFAVLLGAKKDPYDVYKYIINKQKQSKVKFIVFFLVGDYSTHDKSISIQKNNFKTLIKHIGDYCKVGLRISFLGITDTEIIKKEKQRLQGVINTDVVATRNSFSKLNLPKVYRKLINLSIHNDYSMGYEEEVGFRAGTCTPFFFYDINKEIQTPLKLHPYQFSDTAVRSKIAATERKYVLQAVINQTKRVNGNFVAIFHNYTFGKSQQWKGYKDLFNMVLSSDTTNEK